MMGWVGGIVHDSPGVRVVPDIFPVSALSATIEDRNQLSRPTASAGRGSTRAVAARYRLG